MHELSIVSSLLERISVEAQRHQARHVTSVRLRIGELSGVVPEALEHAFEVLREGTPCATAQLDVHYVPAQWSCRECSREILTNAPDSPLRCTACGGSAKLSQGDEILLESMELEVADV